MATAKVHNGVAIVAYVGDKAVDSEGREIKGAPKPPKDTDPSEQPGNNLVSTPEERMGLAIARAMANPKTMVAAATKPAKTSKKSDDETPPVEKTASQKAGELPTAESTTAATPEGTGSARTSSRSRPKRARTRSK